LRIPIDGALRAWAIRVLARYVTEGDDAPGILRRAAGEEVDDERP
jgi:hypothetical protein